MQSSTLVACAENSAKLTPRPSHVAPSGNGLPSRMVERRKAIAAPSSDWFGDDLIMDETPARQPSGSPISSMTHGINRRADWRSVIRHLPRRGGLSCDYQL